MGYALPAAIGAAFSIKKDLYCLIGDGGLMLCLSELATVKKHNLPIKIFIINNRSHGIQKQTLDTWLDSYYACVDESSGLAFPSDWKKLIQSFGLKYEYISNTKDFSKIKKTINEPGPVVYNVEINPCEKLYPFLKFGLNLEAQLP